MKLPSYAVCIVGACAVALLKGCTFTTYARIFVDVPQAGVAASAERINLAAARSGLRSSESGRIGQGGAHYLKYVDPAISPDRELSLTVVFASDRQLEATFAQLNVYDLGNNEVAIYKALVREFKSAFGDGQVHADVTTSRGQRLL
jgi:hypothetical protein